MITCTLCGTQSLDPNYMSNVHPGECPTILAAAQPAPVIVAPTTFTPTLPQVNAALVARGLAPIAALPAPSTAPATALKVAP